MKIYKKQVPFLFYQTGGARPARRSWIRLFDNDFSASLSICTLILKTSSIVCNKDADRDIEIQLEQFKKKVL